MSKVWHTLPQQSQLQVDARSVVSLLEPAPDSMRAAQMLTFLNQVAQVQYLSLVRYDEHLTPLGKKITPTLLDGHTHTSLRTESKDNTTQQCFLIYRQRYYRNDQATDIAQKLHAQAHSHPSQVAALHYSRADVPNPAWRDEIYVRSQLTDRLSLFYTSPQGAAYAINMYRHENYGSFSASEIDSLLDGLTLLRQVHINALMYAVHQSESYEQQSGNLQLRYAHKLNQLAPYLSARESEVCVRIALGMSADGIAADLGIAASSVATLRKRAYAKLGQHHIYANRHRLTHLLS
jgi:DNA-binding CsgD family transcriptional regulator